MYEDSVFVMQQLEKQKKIVTRVIFKVCSSWEKVKVHCDLHNRKQNYKLLYVNICMFLCTLMESRESGSFLQYYLKYNPNLFTYLIIISVVCLKFGGQYIVASYIIHVYVTYIVHTMNYDFRNSKLLVYSTNYNIL